MRSCYADMDTRAIVDFISLPDIDGGSSDQYLLTRINVPKAYRGKGAARKLMALVLEEADREKATIFLEICPSDGLGFNALLRWYRKLGFFKSHIAIYPDQDSDVYRRDPR